MTARTLIYIVALTAIFFTACTSSTTSNNSNSPEPTVNTTESIQPSQTSTPSPSGSGKSTAKGSTSPNSTKTPTPRPNATTTTSSSSNSSSNSTSSNSQSNTTTQNTASPTRTPTPIPTPTRTPTPAPQSSGTITVNTTSITQTVNRSQESAGVINLNTFTITSQGATTFNVVRVNPSSAFSMKSASGGGISPGTSVTTGLTLNSQMITNGTYSQTLLIQYTKDGVSYSGPTVVYTVTLEGNTSTGLMTASTTSINETLSKANATNTAVFGNGFTITSQGSDGFSLVVNRPSNLAEHLFNFGASSNTISNGQTVTIRPYIKTDVANGTYSGTVLVRYTTNHLYIESPLVINYTITLTD